MLKQLLPIALGATQPLAAAAPAATSRAPYVPDANTAPDAEIPVRYIIPKGILPSVTSDVSFEQYLMGGYTNDKKDPIANATWIDSVFMGVPLKATTGLDLRLDEHYEAIRPTGDNESMISVYPHNDSELNSAHLAFASAIPNYQTSIFSWLGSSQDVPFQYSLDSKNDEYWFGGDPAAGVSFTNNSVFSNELSLITFKEASAPYEMKIVDLYEIHDGTGRHDIRFDTTIYFSTTDKTYGPTATSLVAQGFTASSTATLIDATGIDPTTIFNK